MQTNFFQHIASLGVSGTFRISITVENERMLVSVLLSSPGQKDNAAQVVPPMNFRGTATELDEGFFESFKEPAVQTFALFSNMNQYMEQLEIAREKSKEQQDKKTNEVKTKQSANKKYEQQMAKVNQLEADGKFGEAIGQLPKVSDFPEQKDEIEQKNQELRAKRGGELFV